MKKKGLAKFLMIEAILIFIFGLIGTCVLANEKVVEYVEPTFYDDATYETRSVFNGATFVSGATMTIAFSSLVYAASEILEKTEKNNEMLKKLSGFDDSREEDKKENVYSDNRNEGTTMLEDLKNRASAKKG